MCFQLCCRTVLIIVKEEHQFIFLSLAARVVQPQHKAELACQECWDESRANRVGDLRKVAGRAFGDLQISLVPTEGDEGRAPGRSEMRRMGHFQGKRLICEWNLKFL